MSKPARQFLTGPLQESSVPLAANEQNRLTNLGQDLPQVAIANNGRPAGKLGQPHRAGIIQKKLPARRIEGGKPTAMALLLDEDSQRDVPQFSRNNRAGSNQQTLERRQLTARECALQNRSADAAWIISHSA